MELKKDVHIKIEGKFLKGTVIGPNYHTGNVIITNRKVDNISLNTNELREIIQELTELVDTIDAFKVSNTLVSSEESNLF